MTPPLNSTTFTTIPLTHSTLLSHTLNLRQTELSKSQKHNNSTKLMSHNMRHKTAIDFNDSD